MLRLLWPSFMFFFSIPLLIAVEAAENTVNVYTSRKTDLIQPAFSAFTKKTGIQVEYLTGSTENLMERIKAEGPETSADLLLTVDAGNLWNAQALGLFQPVHSQTLETNIPPYLRESEGHWFGLTLRARTIVYSKTRVSSSELSTYKSLDSERWKGRLCLRTARSVYNQSLVATMIANLGVKQTEGVLHGWMNVVHHVFAKDSHLLNAIKSGQCDVGIVNSYYLGRELKQDPHSPIGLFWPNQKDRGVHVNISGGGVVKHAKHPQEAIRLLEFLSSQAAQNLFADQNFEYPVNPEVAPNPLLSEWWGQDFKIDSVHLSAAGIHQAEAIELMKKVGYR